MRINRRQYLVGVAASGTLALAGCSSGGGDDGEPEAESETDTSDAVYDGLRLDGHVMSPSFPFELYESETRVAQIHWHDEGGDWHQAPLQVGVEERGEFDLRINDPDLDPIPAGEGEQYQIGAELTAETPDGLAEIEVTDAVLTVSGQQEGEGGIIFNIFSEGEEIWRSTPLPLEITA